MKYETPKVIALTPAISAVQSTVNKHPVSTYDNGDFTEGVGAYADWED